MCEYLVHATLDCWISRNTLPWYIVAQLVGAQNETLMAGGDELRENTNPLQGLTFEGIMVKRRIMYSKQS